MITKHELDCLWYQSEREWAGRQRLTSGPFIEDEDLEHESFRTATGYECSVYRDEVGNVEVVLIDPPTNA